MLEGAGIGGGGGPPEIIDVSAVTAPLSAEGSGVITGPAADSARLPGRRAIAQLAWAEPGAGRRESRRRRRPGAMSIRLSQARGSVPHAPVLVDERGRGTFQPICSP
jgi:hypothetical protein